MDLRQRLLVFSLLHLCLLLGVSATADGSGDSIAVSVRLIEYWNYEGKLETGVKCDNVSETHLTAAYFKNLLVPTATETCDPYFIISILSGTRLLQGRISQQWQDTDNITFGAFIDERSLIRVPNPFQFQLTRWPQGGVKIRFKALDVNRDGPQLIADWAVELPVMTRTTQTLTTTIARLKVSVAAECLPNFYGADCSTLCVEDRSSYCEQLTGERKCRPGFTGENCETLDPCGLVTCQNQGTCVAHGNNVRCACVAGYSGERCQYDTFECSSSPCLNGGTCEDLLNDYACHCQPGFTGKRCGNDIDHCRGVSCLNGGVCEEVNNQDYVCQCAGRFTGVHCETEYADPCASNPCDNGVCTSQGANYSCACQLGFEGPRCATMTDNCQSDPCIHGLCENSLAAYTCSCHTGYSGTNCEFEVDECDSSPCHNGGRCRDELGRYVCDCAAGWSGSQCETDLDECQDNDSCVSGTCVNTPGSHHCVCDSGYSGLLCEVNEGLDNCTARCQNGDCITTGSDTAEYSCQCHSGYTGSHCDLERNPCGSSPCANGSCGNWNDSFICSCYRQLCEVSVDPCLPSPCHNGTCRAAEAGYQCDCFLGYTGYRCEVLIDYCATDPCVHGNCSNTINGYECTCTEAYEGQRCNTSSTSRCSNDECPSGSRCIDAPQGALCIFPYSSTAEEGNANDSNVLYLENMNATINCSCSEEDELMCNCTEAESHGITELRSVFCQHQLWDTVLAIKFCQLKHACHRMEVYKNNASLKLVPDKAIFTCYTIASQNCQKTNSETNLLEFSIRRCLSVHNCSTTAASDKNRYCYKSPAVKTGASKTTGGVKILDPMSDVDQYWYFIIPGALLGIIMVVAISSLCCCQKRRKKLGGNGVTKQKGRQADQIRRFTIPREDQTYHIYEGVACMNPVFDDWASPPRVNGFYSDSTCNSGSRRLAADNIYDEPRKYLTLRGPPALRRVDIQMNGDYSEPHATLYATPYSESDNNSETRSYMSSQAAETEQFSLPPPSPLSPDAVATHDSALPSPELPPPPPMPWLGDDTNKHGCDNFSYHYEAIDYSDDDDDDDGSPGKQSSANPLYDSNPGAENSSQFSKNPLYS